VAIQPPAADRRAGPFYFAASRKISILKRYFIELSCFGYPEGALALSDVKCRKEKLFADLIGEVSPIDAAATTLGPR
jgi:hypothetical protein